MIMNRRDFLRLGALSGAAFFTEAGLATAWASSGAAPRFHVKPFALEEATISQLQALMASGKSSAVTLTKKYLARIEKIDRHGPKLNSAIETNPDAIAIAA